MKLLGLHYLFPFACAVNAVSFTYDGVLNAIQVLTNDANGSQRQLQRDIKRFLVRNSGLADSGKRELTRRVNRPGRNKLVPLFSWSAVDTIVNLGQFDARGTAKDVIHYAYVDRDVRTTIKNLILRILHDYPTIADDFFHQSEIVARNYPHLSQNSKQNLINFSRRDPRTYFEAADLLIRLATLMPDFVGHIGIRFTQTELAACSRNCRCPRPRTFLPSQE